MLTLAFDTCNNVVSTAILRDDKLLSKDTIFENSKQAELLILAIEETLKKNNIWYQDLDLIATVNGPGSFTAVRIGLACAKAIKIATNKPLILLNSCEVVARKYLYEGKIIVVNDAKMDEFFGAKFFGRDTIEEPRLIRLDELNDFLDEDDFLLCGTAKKIVTKFLHPCHPRAGIDPAVWSPGMDPRLRGDDKEEDDNVEADLMGLLAYEKFNKGYFNDDSLPLYLRMPKIEKRKK